MSYLTIADAAKRVGKSERSVRNWIADKEVKVYLGRIREDDLLACDRRMRDRKRQGRPKAQAPATPPTVPVAALEAYIAEIAPEIPAERRTELAHLIHRGRVAA